MNACVALAKDWRTDKYLRRLEVNLTIFEVDALRRHRILAALYPHFAATFAVVGTECVARRGLSFICVRSSQL